MATATDLVFLDDDELEQRLHDARRELFNLRFQLATGQLDNTARLQRVRRDIARLLTILREREIEEAEGTYEPPSEEQRALARIHLEAEAAKEAEATKEVDAGDDVPALDDEDAGSEIADDLADVDDVEFEDPEEEP